MLTAGRIYWIVWFLVGFGVFEYIGLRRDNDFPTLSATVRWMLEGHPVIAYLVGLGLGAVFFWLMLGHWLWDRFDRPGLEPRELGTIVAGAVFGIAAVMLGRRKKK